MGNRNSNPEDQNDRLKEQILSSYQHERHPLGKLRAQLQTADPSKRHVILLSTGAMNPVHRMHVHIFDVAKQYLENGCGFQVIGGFISPSHDRYLQGKLGRHFIPAVHRVKMCELATQESPWVNVDYWESLLNDQFVSFFEVLVDLKKYILSQIGNNYPADSQPVFMYLCGTDLAIRCRLYDAQTPFPVICVGRPGYRDKLQAKMDEMKNELPRFTRQQISPVSADEKAQSPAQPLVRLFYHTEDDVEDVSSTQIRDAVMEGKNFSFFTTPEVGAYLNNHPDLLESMKKGFEMPVARGKQ